MKETLLAALKSKFAGVQEAILDRIATKKAGTVTDENQIQTIVDGMSYDDIITSESDYRAEQTSKSAAKKAVSDYESKHKLKDGKPIEDPEKKPADEGGDTGKAGGEEEKIPAWAKGLQESVSKLNDTVQGVVKSQQTASKQSQAAELLKGSKIPEKYQKLWLPRIKLDDEETSLEDQVKALETEYLGLKQELVNSSVESGDFGEGGKGEAGDADMKGFLDEKFGTEETAQAK